MKAKNVNHSKVKNSGILFELLVRQITVDTLEGKKHSSALEVMRTHFKPTTELGKELQLYRTFFGVKPLSEVKAAQLIDLVTGQHKKLDTRKLAREKYEVIKTIKENYDLKSFLSTKIPNYPIYASIYKTLLAESVDFNVANIQEVAVSRFTLIEHLVKERKPSTKNEEGMIETFRNQSEDVRLLSYKIMLDKFNNKYQNLGEKQKVLLREYINSVPNSDSFVKYVRSEIEPLQTQLRTLREQEGDQVLKIKLNEVSSQLNKIGTKSHIKDNELTAMMIAYQIVQELGTK